MNPLSLQCAGGVSRVLYSIVLSVVYREGGGLVRIYICESLSLQKLPTRTLVNDLNEQDLGHQVG